MSNMAEGEIRSVREAIQATLQSNKPDPRLHDPGTKRKTKL